MVPVIQGDVVGPVAVVGDQGADRRWADPCDRHRRCEQVAVPELPLVDVVGADTVDERRPDDRLVRRVGVGTLRRRLARNNNLRGGRQRMSDRAVADRALKRLDRLPARQPWKPPQVSERADRGSRQTHGGRTLRDRFGRLSRRVPNAPVPHLRSLPSPNHTATARASRYVQPTPGSFEPALDRFRCDLQLCLRPTLANRPPLLIPAS